MSCIVFGWHTHQIATAAYLHEIPSDIEHFTYHKIYQIRLSQNKYATEILMHVFNNSLQVTQNDSDGQN